MSAGRRTLPTQDTGAYMRGGSECREKDPPYTGHWGLHEGEEAVSAGALSSSGSACKWLTIWWSSSDTGGDVRLCLMVNGWPNATHSFWMRLSKPEMER